MPPATLADGWVLRLESLVWLFNRPNDPFFSPPHLLLFHRAGSINGKNCYAEFRSRENDYVAQIPCSQSHGGTSEVRNWDLVSRTDFPVCRSAVCGMVLFYIDFPIPHNLPASCTTSGLQHRRCCRNMSSVAHHQKHSFQWPLHSEVAPLVISSRAQGNKSILRGNLAPLEATKWGASFHPEDI